jgi:hypothetical protein
MRIGRSHERLRNNTWRRQIFRNRWKFLSPSEKNFLQNRVTMGLDVFKQNLGNDLGQVALPEKRSACGYGKPLFHFRGQRLRGTGKGGQSILM